MPIRKFLHKFKKSAVTKIETLLGYTANRQRSGWARSPYERVDTPPVSLKPEGWITRRKQIVSAISYQWLPANSESSSVGQSSLTVRNPDLNPITYLSAEELTEASASEDSDDSDEESIDIDWANRFFFERPSSRLAKAIEEDYDEDLGDQYIAIISESLPQGLSSSAEFYPEHLDSLAVYNEDTDTYHVASRTSSESYTSRSGNFPTPTLGNALAIPSGLESTEHVAKRPDQHVSWNLPSPRQHTFLQRIAEKLQARASSRKESTRASRSDHPGKSHSRKRTPSPSTGSSRENASHRHRDPRSRSSRDAHKPRPILKSSIGRPQPQTLVHELGPSQPRTLVHELGPSQPLHELGPSQAKILVHKQGYRNLTALVPIVIVTPPNNPTPPPTTILDFLQSPENLNVLPALLHQNPSRSQSSQTTYSHTVVERSESLTPHPGILDFATLSSTKVGPSTLVSASSGQSQVLLTAPSSHSSPVIPTRWNSLPSSFRLSTSVKHRDSKEEIKARCAAKRAEVESLNKKFEQAKRELGEFEAVLWEMESLETYERREDEVEELISDIFFCSL